MSLGEKDPEVKKAYELAERWEWAAKARPGSHWMAVRSMAAAAAIAIWTRIRPLR